MFTLMTLRRSLHSTAAREEESIPSSKSSRVSWRRGERRFFRRTLKCCWSTWQGEGRERGRCREERERREAEGEGEVRRMGREREKGVEGGEGGRRVDGGER